MIPAEEQIDLLIGTDCISEGQNLQDCDTVINFDIQWNPVSLIQRFGRIDRIGSKNTNIQMINFFPNMELNEYLGLEARVKYDIRDWAPEHEKMGKGVTLTHNEAEKLSALLKGNL